MTENDRVTRDEAGVKKKERTAVVPVSRSAVFSSIPAQERTAAESFWKEGNRLGSQTRQAKGATERWLAHSWTNTCRHFYGRIIVTHFPPWWKLNPISYENILVHRQNLARFFMISLSMVRLVSVLKVMTFRENSRSRYIHVHPSHTTVVVGKKAHTTQEQGQKRVIE